MNNRTFFFALHALALAFASLSLSGCNYLKQRTARHAYAEYQQAISAGDMVRARAALTTLVNTDEDVSDYWMELGKLQLQMGQFRDAYDSFAHAHELDRSNIDVLSAMTQLALLSGQLDIASEQARSLALLAPDNPAVTLVQSHLALRAGDLDKAEAGADALLEAEPTNPFAKVLKARVLILRNRMDDAIAVLEEQHRAVPQDRAAIRALVAIYRSREDWRNLARIQTDAHKLDPKETSISLSATEAFLRARNVPAAAKMSMPLLSAQSPAQLIDAAFDLWVRYAPAGTVLPDAVRQGSEAQGDRRVAFANYFNQVGKPALAERLLGHSTLPVTHVNARLNAVLAQSMALGGRLAEAKQLFDEVLDREPDQVEALRGRTALQARTGVTKQAIIDAQRLVTLRPNSGQDRLLLAQAFMAARNEREVRQTLWQAFQELPGDERVFAALKSVLASSGDIDGQRRLNDEVADRRVRELTKDMV